MLFKAIFAFAIVTIMAVEGSRQFRSPGGAGWQGNGFDSGAAFSARSSPGGYGSLGRSSGWGSSFASGQRSFGGSGGWQGSSRSFGSNSVWDAPNYRSTNFDGYSSGW
ncbi:unnamed protein product, partial [Iphiclides podalirius]